jgi:hypothetical protein
MPNENLPISFGDYLITCVIHKITEKTWLGSPFVRIGRILTISAWLYETGAILGRRWKDKLPVVMQMYEIEEKRSEFTIYWSNQAKKRIDQYGGSPKNFQTFMIHTDLELFWNSKIQDFIKIGDKKLNKNQAQESLQLASLSLLEGIMFGSLYPDITKEMLTNTYEKVDMNAWKEARKYGLTLSKNPPYTSVLDKEEQAIELARDYVKQYHPNLINALNLE